MSLEKCAGTINLVGAGPGPADLLTVRALRAIEGAEALLYDALVSAEVLSLAPAHCLKIQTGKRAGRTSMSQDTINLLMLKLVRRGLRVVRLKGGDPSLFGRVGEELDFLTSHGVEASVIPGVTAACAAAAQFKMPLTHRGDARRVTFATARLSKGALQEDWTWDPQSTLALYMARDSIGAVIDRLCEQGMSPFEPVAAIENAGSEQARMIQAPAHAIGRCVSDAAPTGPVVIVVGQVAARQRTVQNRAMSEASQARLA